MTPAVWIAILGAAAWIPGIWGIVEAVRRHRTEANRAVDEGDRMVVKSALELLQPYKVRVEELETTLATAEHTIRDMNEQLAAANRQVSDLSSKLSDAQAEIGYLRVQVKTLSQQLPEH